MVNEEILAKYREVRRGTRFTTASDAITQARSEAPSQAVVIPWDTVKNEMDTVKKATITRGKLVCSIRMVYDFDHDYSKDRGKFVHTPEEGMLVCPLDLIAKGNPPYFVPINLKDSCRQDLIDLGMTKSDADILARQYVREDMMLVGDPDGQGCQAYGVIVQVFCKGIELACSSKFGIELSSTLTMRGTRTYDDSKFEAIAQQKLQEAFDAAEEKLAELREP